MTVTRTFGTKLLPTYVANTIIEIVHFRDMTFDVDERTAFYLDTASAVVDVGSFNIAKIPDLDGDESDTEKALALSKAESQSNKIGLKLLSRKNNTGDWDEIAEFIILNYGRKDYLDLRGRLGYPSRILEKNDALAVQMVDYGDGLLWDTDFIKIDIGVTVEISKKNDVQALTSRIAALELAVEGKLINLPPNTLLGRNTGAGTVEQISASKFATPAMIDQAIIDLVGGAPGALNTLVELAAALNNDANFAATIANSLALKAPLANPNFTGFIKLGDNVAIKIKILSFVSPTTDSNTQFLYGQLPPMDKIIGLTGWLRCADTDYYPPSFYSASKGYTNWWSAYSWSSNLYINLHPSALAKMGNQPGTVMIAYIA